MPMTDEHFAGRDEIPVASWETITSRDNLLILAARPGDESQGCGGLIARCCRRGRAPVVIVLTDGGSTSANPGSPATDELAIRHERETRAAVRCLGLPATRLLLAGLFEGTIPTGGPAFDAIVEGITMVMWGRDCNIICAPSPDGAVGEEMATHRIAVEVVKRSGAGLLSFQSSGRRQAMVTGCSDVSWCRLDIAPEHAAKEAAISAHLSRFGETSLHVRDAGRYEVFSAKIVGHDLSSRQTQLHGCS
jgi:LmbE family N-acetylglucosaminyl deacetylase